MKKKFIATLLSLTLAFSLAACGNKATDDKKKDNGKTQEQKAETTKKKDGGTLVFSSASDPLTLNPLLMGDRTSFTVNNALFDPLFVENGDKTTYFLAKDLKVSDDMLTYTLTLKDGLKWHDGQKITSDDILFTVKTILDKNQNIEARGGFLVNNKEVKVEKKDDLTVEFKLPEVFVPFKAALADFKPIPKHIFEKEKNIEKAQASVSKPVGSGPFKFKEWKKGEVLTLERFNDYYSGKPHIEKVAFRVIADSNSATSAFENGEITAASIGEETYDKMSKENKFNAYSYPGGMTYYMVMNMKNPILAKKEVRQAISYALNKTEIINSYANETLTQKAFSVFPPSAKYYTTDIEKYDHNVDKAKELMKKANIEKGKLKFMYSGDGLPKKIALVVQQQLKEIGLDVELSSLDQQVFHEKIMGEKKRDYDLTLNGYSFGAEPSNYAGAYFTGAKFNASEYSNKELDKLFKDAKVEKDETKRKEMYEKIQKIIAEDAPVYTIDYPTEKLATQKNLGGIKEAKLAQIYMFEDLSKLYFTE